MMNNCKLIKECQDIGLRKRQILTIVRTFNRLKHYRKLLTVAGTGYGKTYIFTSIIKLLTKFDMIDGKVLVISNRLVLLDQIDNTFKHIVGCPIKLISSKSTKFEKFNQMTIQTYVSLKDNKFKLPRLDLVIIDEAHFSGANSYKDLVDEVVDNNINCIVLGYTATPTRSDKQSLFSIFETVVDEVQLGHLVSKGLLTKSKLVSCYLYDDFTFYDRVYAKYREFKEIIKKHLKTIIYCGDIKECEKLYEIMKPHEKVGMVHSNIEVQSVLDEFRSGKIDIIINVRILVEGFDCPEVNCILICKEINHLGTLIQMVGRACRLYEGKNEYYCLDFKDNFQNLMPEEVNFMEHIPLSTEGISKDKFNKLLETDGHLGIINKSNLGEEIDPTRCYTCRTTLLNKNYCYICFAKYIGITNFTMLKYKLFDNTIKEYNTETGTSIRLIDVIKGNYEVNKLVSFLPLHHDKSKLFTLIDVGRIAHLSGNGIYLYVYWERLANSNVWFFSTGFSGKLFVIIEDKSTADAKSEVCELLNRLRCIFLQGPEAGIIGKYKPLSPDKEKTVECFSMSDNLISSVVTTNYKFLNKCLKFLKKLTVSNKGK